MAKTAVVLALLALVLPGCGELAGFDQHELDVTLNCSDGECECAASYDDCDGDLSDGCEDTATSLEHCGACGSRCGGTCQDGRCVPFSVLATNVEFASFAMSDTHVVAGMCTDGVRIVSLPDDQPIDIADADCVEAVAADETEFFFSTWASASDAVVLKRGSFDGASPQLVVTATPGTYISDLVVAEELFWIEDGVALRRAARDGVAVELLVQPPVEESLSALQIQDSRLFWKRSTFQAVTFTGAALITSPTAGATRETMVFYDKRFAGPFVIAAEHVYWTSIDALFRTPLAGGESEQLVLDATVTAATSLAVDEQHIYWVDADARRVARAPLDGGTVEVLADGQPDVRYLRVDSDWIYWATRDGMVRVHK